MRVYMYLSPKTGHTACATCCSSWLLSTSPDDFASRYMYPFTLWTALLSRVFYTGRTPFDGFILQVLAEIFLNLVALFHKQLVS